MYLNDIDHVLKLHAIFISTMIMFERCDFVNFSVCYHVDYVTLVLMYACLDSLFVIFPLLVIIMVPWRFL